MEIMVIALVLALYGVSYFVYYMYGKDKTRGQRKRKFYDHFWP